MRPSLNIRNEAIAASAGTGKTYQLALRYISLLAAGVAPETIVALTFSRKAAGEIFDRIVQQLAAWIHDPEEFEKKNSAFALPAMTTEDLIDRMRVFLRALHMLPVGTIDSFFVRIIRSFPFEFGLTGEFEIIDDLLLLQARERVFRHILWNAAAQTDTNAFCAVFKQATWGHEEKKLNKLLHDFVEENYAAYLATLGCAKWGDKAALWPGGNDLCSTKSDTEKDIAAVRKALDAHNNLSKRAAWDDFLDEASGFTATSALAKSMRLFENNLLPALKSLEQGVCDIKGYNRGKNDLAFSKSQCRHLAQLLRHITACLIENALTRSRGMHEIIGHYEQSYERLFRRSGKLTFNDIVYLLSPIGYRRNALVLSHSVSEENKLYIDYRLDSRYAHWLLDEFQDTSRAQWTVLKNLVDEVMQSSDGSKSFFYVGDTKQAIYGWRGGAAGLFSSVYEDLHSRYANFSLRPLSDSYRSGPAVIETVERVFAPIARGAVDVLPPGFCDKWQWNTHSTNRDTIAGYATLVEVEKQKDDTARSMLEKRANAIVAIIRQIQPAQRDLSTALLARTNASAQAFAQLLEQNGIRTALEGTVSLCDSDMVKALISLIALAQHPGDTFAWQHVCMTPLGELFGDRTAAAMRMLDDIHERGFACAIGRVLDEYNARYPGEINAFSRQRAGELISAAQRFDETGSRNCLDFIDFVRAYRIPAPARSGAVQVLTVHKAKGLEYDIVFMPELTAHRSITRANLSGVKVKRNGQGAAQWAVILPKRAVAQQDSVLAGFINELDMESLNEELCVLYVGMTRAAHALYMIADERGKSAESIHAADILRQTLSSSPDTRGRTPLPGPAGMTCLYESGEQQWYTKHEIRPQEPPQPSEAGTLTVRFDGALSAATPSHAEQRTIALSDILSGASGAAMNLGTAVHSLFEQLANLQTQDAGETARQWRQSALFSDEEKQRACDLFLASIESADVKAALSPDPAASEIWRERPFDIILDGQWISGIFDRVTIEYDTRCKIRSATVLDYKTDSCENKADIDRIVSMYTPQLNLYKKVLARLIDIDCDKICTQLLLVRSALIISLDT
jgi:ATP-dependent exoDNAse (exonuclease V) beta subunit